jgi:ABC-2 type transport system permease protein
MREVMIVAKNEIRTIVVNKWQLLAGMFFAVAISAQGLASGSMVSTGQGVITPETRATSLFLFMGLLLGYTYSAHAYLREKREGVIESILCTPLNLPQIWLGKAVGVAALATGLLWMFTPLVVLVWRYALLENLPLTGGLIFHVVVTTPLLIAFAVGAMGFVQCKLGMRENMFLNIIMLAMLIGGLMVMASVQSILFGGWVGAVVMATLGLVGSLVLHHFAQFLSKERIVRTIPE